MWVKRLVNVLVLIVGMLVSLSVVAGNCDNHESDKDPNGTPSSVFVFEMDMFLLWGCWLGMRDESVMSTPCRPKIFILTGTVVQRLVLSNFLLALPYIMSRDTTSVAFSLLHLSHLCSLY